LGGPLSEEVACIRPFLRVCCVHTCSLVCLVGDIYYSTILLICLHWHHYMRT